MSMERNTAVIVVITKEEGGLFVLPGGEYRNRAIELAIVAVVLHELDAKWQIVRTETLGVT